MNYAEVAPAFVAARSGYDVWLGNSRGNTYSLGNTELDPWKDGAKYWDFSWHEMGHFDLPATLDYMTTVTGVEKAAYVGHSQGTSQMFVGLADMEDYFKEKISVFVALAPVTMIPNTQTKLLRLAAKFYTELDDAAYLFGIHSALNNTWYTSRSVSLFCNSVPWFCLALE